MNIIVRIFIADDHPIFMEGLIKIIEKEKTFKVCGSSSNGEDALSFIKTNKPDIAILDISMPGISGIDISKVIKNEKIKTLPIILTMYNDEVYLEEALENGVTGYLLKDSTLTDINDCIKTVINGGYYISKQLQNYLITGRREKTGTGDLKKLIANLTPTEKEILKKLSLNKTSSQIAEEMHVSFRTIQNHRMNISHKLGISGHNALLMFAIKNKDLH